MRPNDKTRLIMISIHFIPNSLLDWPRVYIL